MGLAVLELPQLDNRHVAFVSIAVRPEHRRRGSGRCSSRRPGRWPPASNGATSSAGPGTGSSSRGPTPSVPPRATASWTRPRRGRLPARPGVQARPGRCHVRPHVGAAARTRSGRRTRQGGVPVGLPAHPVEGRHSRAVDRGRRTTPGRHEHRHPHR
ncbi:hypothetical protein [Tessaracoccus coleopterorum]|uniref:hypothetical protein n=1 Tax=Tessaracoccus coleopterorum TaxID=2714950 RepID=UPI0038CD6F7B